MIGASVSLRLLAITAGLFAGACVSLAAAPSLSANVDDIVQRALAED